MDPAHCQLSLEQVDVLNDHAHRIELYGALVANVLDDFATKDQILEGLQELVRMTITHAEGIQAVMTQGCQAAKTATDQPG